jgi:SAM-dependent methyltransferase
LELGCGTGLFTEKFAQTGAELVAIDVSPDLLKIARARNLPAERVCFLEGRFEEEAIDGHFDAVIGSSVVHHLELKRALPRIYELLKPGGILGFTEPNMLNPLIMVQKNIPWLKEKMGDSPDETAFVRWKFRTTLFEAGFDQVQIQPFDWLHPATPKGLIPLVQSLGFFLEKIPVLREFAGSLYIHACRPA